MLLAFVLAFSGASFAASKKDKALKAYRKYLEKEEKKAGSMISKWSLAYLDKDDIPEMVTYYSILGHGAKPCIFTAKNGKVKQVSFSAANGYGTHYYKKKGIVRYSSDSWEWEEYCKVNFKSKELMSALDSIAVMENGKYYKDNGSGERTQITKKQYTALVRKQIGTAKAVKLKYYKNDAKNRKKHLK